MLKMDFEELQESGKKGDWCFLNNAGRTLLVLRYGDDSFKDVVVLPVTTELDPSGRCWSWNGDTKVPTLTPSILVRAYAGWTDGWHGYLKDGILIDV